MKRLIVYSFATLMDIVLSAVLFVCMVRLAEMHFSAKVVAASMAVWALTYTASSLAAGSIVTPANAAGILVACCLGSAGLAAGFILLPAAGVIFVLIALQGCVTAFFFTPFQVFMKLFDQGQNKDVSHSSGLYVFSWSSGYALGPFIAGFLWQGFGWKACHVFNAVASVAMAVGVLLLGYQAEGTAAQPADENGSTAGPPELLAIPDLAWMAWVFSGFGCLLASMNRSLFPKVAEAYGLSKPQQGTVFLLLSGVQALIGLALGRVPHWMYRPAPVLVFGGFGIAGLAVFGLVQDARLFYLAAGLFSIYAGFFYYYFVFHSLIHPTRHARYISINEALVGVAGISGPFLGGLLADQYRLSTPYFAAVALLAASVLVQALLHARQRQRKLLLEVSASSLPPGGMGGFSE